MFSSERNPRASFKPDGEFLKGDSNFYQSQNLSHEATQLQLQQQGNGLTRYRSAPSAVFATLLNPDNNDNGSSSGDDESEAMFTAFMNGPPIDLNQKNGVHHYAMKQEVGLESDHRPGQVNGFSNGQMGSAVGSYSVRGGNGNCSNNLIRQSSSPAGFYGFNITGELGNYKVSEASSSAGGMNNQINFSSGPSLTSRFMPSIPEAVNENISARPTGNGSGFGHDSWNETSFNSLKRNNDGELKMFSTFNGLENQNGETRKNSSGLVHQLSLPNTSSEMADIEKYLHFQQEVVPCQIRAKRGCATHPRSIAERNRRTRIANKMKKLQDLFPNMDKQANQADMLEWAVDQIKDLQKQVQTLKCVHEKCICPGKSQ